MAASYNLTVARLSELAQGIERRAARASKYAGDETEYGLLALDAPPETVRAFWVAGLVWWNAAEIARLSELAAAQRRSLESIAKGLGFDSAEQLASGVGIALGEYPRLFLGEAARAN